MLLLFFTESTKSSLFVLATLVSFLFKKIKNGFLYFSYIHVCVCVCVCIYIYIYMEKEIATYSILAWKISWTEETSRLQFMESQRVGHDLVTKQQHLFSKLVLSKT